jgi:DNA (cytosine-5)-methyltransferase 1
MTRKILVADLLCGAGGSSTGCERALAELGLKMELVCVNHWATAIETHTKNHPNARHFVQDISTVRPHLIVPEGYLDLLMASPTCTHHSVARGGKPTSDQQRSDPWHIITWLTELRVKRMIIENVWEFIGWGPVDPRTGKPIASRKGEYFRAWIDTIRRLGFDPQWRKLNAADYGDATTRQRFILMARSDTKTVVWPMPTHARKAEHGLALFPTVKPWRPAREIIDWNIKGRSIFSRKKPLAPKTLARIHAGAVKFGWPEPFLVILRNHMAGQSVEQPLPTIAAGGTHIGLAQPIANGVPTFEDWYAKTKHLGGTRQEYDRLYLDAEQYGRRYYPEDYAEPIMLANRSNNTAKNPDDEPLPCLTTAHGGGIAIAEPVIINGRKNNQAKAVSTDPVPTLDTKGGVWLAEPFVLSQQNSGQPRSVDDDPLPTITTGGAGAEKHEGCARPMLVEPFILSRQGGGAPRSTDAPTPAQVAKHSHVLISPYYGTGSGETCNSADEPLPTLTGKNRFGMVVPVTHTNGSNQARSVDDPVPTLTTAKGGEFAIVMPVTHAGGFDRALDANGDPLPTITGANRGELAVITAQHGERDGQAPRVHSIEEPVPTIAATGHVDLAQGVVTPVFDGQQYDILFRMLEPHELAAAMGFTTEDQAYEFAGTKTEQIKQIGNAVSVRKMAACVGAIMADAAPKQKPAAQRAPTPAIAKVA